VPPRRISRGPTIVDVARAAEVSVSTVSRVVRNHPDVQAETRARVQEAIDLLRYRPSPIARALVSGQSRLIALLVSDIANPFYPQLAKSIEQEAKRGDYTVVICNTDDRTAETRRYLKRLLSQGLDGVIHASVARDEPLLLKLMADPRRVVFTNRRPAGESLSFVVSDNRRGAEELTKYLLAREHRRIGFVAGPDFASNATERLEGFLKAMDGAQAAEALVARGDFTAESGARAAREWTDSPHAPTAIIAVNDSIALGVLEVLIDRGIRVPEDIALAGFDGVQLAASPFLNLTTVDQHIEEMGRQAVRILLRQLSDGAPARPANIVLPTQLLLRKSTEGAPARRPLAWRQRAKQTGAAR
jgi:LacI family transcriptional regulator